MTHVVVAPFSNGDIRDWPAERFGDLIARLLGGWERPDGVVRVVGAPGQRLRAGAVVRPFPSTRVVNDCGRAPWSATVELVRTAACVVGNNSGVTHLAARLGAPAVCVFSGSHQRLQWGPRGRRVVTLSSAIGCSPCDLVHGRDCLYGKLCLDRIEPELVVDTMLGLMARAA